MKRSWILIIPIIFVMLSGYAWSDQMGQDMDSAISSKKKATELAPDDPSNFIELANLYFKNKQYDEAITAEKKVVTLMPDNSNVFVSLASYYRENKQYDEAITAAKRAIELKPDNDVAYYNLGYAYAKKKQYDEAIKALQKAIEIDPYQPLYRQEMGALFILNEDYAGAIEIYKKAVELQPAYINSINTYADIYKSMGKYDDAIESVKLQNINSLIILANTYRLMGKYDDAVESANKAIELQTRETIMDKSAAGSVGIRSFINRSKGNQEESFRDAEKAYSLDPADAFAMLSLGAAYLDQGKNAEAIKLLSQVKDNTTARILEATAYAKLDKMKEAVDVYLSIPEEKISPKNIPLMSDRMTLLQIFKPLAKEHMDKAKSFESKKQYKNALSEICEALKTADDTEAQDIQEAMFSLTRKHLALSELPEDARKHVLRGELLVTEGKFEPAAAEFKAAIEIAPYVARLYRSAALIDGELKQYPEAIRQMNIYLKATPDAPLADKDEVIKWEFMIEKGGP